MKNLKIVFLGIVILLGLLSCKDQVKTSTVPESEFMTKENKILDIQGHRGCRGLYPENTIPAFIKALDLGVTTLELDVVITKDSLVLSSHEPWFSHEIALDAEGNEITLEGEKEHRIYDMNYDQTQEYDCGLKTHPRFPNQKKIAVSKPLLSEVIDTSEAHSNTIGRPLPYYNIETKSAPEGDGIFHPEPDAFSELLVKVLIEKKIEERSIIQSFDPRTLQYIHGKYPQFKLALLVENGKEPEALISELGFTPDIYSPDFKLVDKALIDYCAEQNMKCIPWTVNTAEESQVLINLGVDGIITDYPDRIVPISH